MELTLKLYDWLNIIWCIFHVPFYWYFIKKVYAWNQNLRTPIRLLCEALKKLELLCLAGFSLFSYKNVLLSCLLNVKICERSSLRLLHKRITPSKLILFYKKNIWPEFSELPVRPWKRFTNFTKPAEILNIHCNVINISKWYSYFQRFWSGYVLNM